QKGHSDIMKLLVATGADTNKANKDGRTPSHWAASRDDDGALDVLIAAGADVDKADGRGRTPSSVTARQGQASALETLICAGADVREVSAADVLKTQQAGKAARQAKNARTSEHIARLCEDNAALSAENARLSAENAGLREGTRVDVVNMETCCVVQEMHRKRPREDAPLAGPVDESDAAPSRSALSAVHRANTKLVAVKRERDDTQEELSDEQDEHHTMRAFSLKQQNKIAELVDMALDASADPVAINAIRDRH
ncbi:ankyrin repeat-containing domain protein, partial [Pelagophyceae sp. CCMP2097]